MKHLLYYDPALVGTDEGQTSMEDFKSEVEKAAETGPRYQLRDATQWRGELEVSENQYPGRVLLASGGHNDTLFAKLREAYETVNVPVSDVDIEGPFGPFDSEDDAGEGDFDALKAEATALGVPFTDATEYGALKNMVADATRIKQAAAASLHTGKGNALDANDAVNRANARVGAGDANARAGNLDPANMAKASEDGIKLTDDKGHPAQGVGSDAQGGEGEGDADEDEFDGDIELLKEKADELGVEYAPNIGYDTLKARVDAKAAE